MNPKCMMISTYLKNFQAIFSPAIEAFFQDYRQQVENLWPLSKEMFEKLAEFTLRGGKRMRPALLYYSYTSFSEENPDTLLPVCIAAELMQSFLLIHDDIMDQADLRRGGKTIHQQFSNSKAYYGESMAILIGNLAGYLGLRAIVSSEFDEVLKNRLMDLYSQICIDVGYGQALDILADTLPNLQEENIYAIYRYKTARYTTEFPLLSAGILTRQNDEFMSHIKNLAINLGILFQIQDDILGLFGDSQKIGKSTSLDLIHGKKTLLVCKAFEKGNAEQKKILMHVYGNINATPDDIVHAKKIVIDTGALIYAQEAIKNCASCALKEIPLLKLNSEVEIFLKALVDYCGNRSD